MTKAMASASPIQTICLPVRVDQSRKSVSPISWVAPQMLNQPQTSRMR